LVRCDRDPSGVRHRPRPSWGTIVRAVIQRQYGPASELEIGEVEVPTLGKGHVLVQVCAASVHPGDYFVVTGEPYLLRLVYGLRRPKHGIPGMDLAGVVAAVGEDVTSLRPGDTVFGWGTAGALAEFATVPAEQLVPCPSTCHSRTRRQCRRRA